jgi:serine protease Do
MRGSGLLSFVSLLIVVLIGEMSKDDERPRPIIVDDEPEQPLRPVRPPSELDPDDVGPGQDNDDVIVIQDDEKGRRQQYTGTAFSIDERGLWVTARHVTDQCDRLTLLRPFRSPLPVVGLSPHSSADVSLLQTESGYEALDVEYATPEYNQEGFHFGFPRGEPGSVYSRLIGQKTMKTVGRRTYKETVHVWAEQIRIPDSDESLGGISGGPILNKNGDVVGIHVAGSIRRGRSFSSLPENIEDLLERSGVSLQPGDEYNIDQNSLTSVGFSRVGDALRSDITVAQVICRTD